MSIKHSVPADGQVNSSDYFAENHHVFSGTPGMLLGADGAEVNPASFGTALNGTAGKLLAANGAEITLGANVALAGSTLNITADASAAASSATSAAASASTATAAKDQALGASGAVTIVPNLAGFISPTGVFTSHADYLASAAISCLPGDYVVYSGYGVSAIAMVTFYDNASARISGVLGRAAGGLTYGTVRAPAGTASVRVSTGNPASGASVGISYRFERSSVLPVAPVATNTAIADPDDSFGNLADFATTSGYINSAGVGPASADSNWVSSGFIKVEPGRIIEIDAVAATSVNILSFYDADGVYLSGTPGITSDGSLRTKASVTVPAQADTVRVCAGNTLSSSITIQWSGGLFAPQAIYRKIAVPQKGSRIVKPADTIVTYGDSRTSTDYPFIQDAVANAFGCSALTRGASGYTAASLAATNTIAFWVTNLVAVPRAIILLVAGNDSGASGTVGTFSSSSVNGVAGESVVTPTSLAVDYAGTKLVQAVDHIVRKLQAAYSNIRTRANLTGSETEAEKNAKIAAVQQVMIFLCTDLPQQRTDSSDPFSIPANWERKRQAIIEVGQRNHVKIIDTMDKLPVDMSLEPYWVGPTDKVTNNGVWTMDGLHPNQHFWKRIAEFVAMETGLAETQR